jgi:hypothetical protein
MSPAEKQAFARTLGTPQAAKQFMARAQQLRSLGALQ